MKALSPTGNYYYTLPMEKQPEVLSLNIDYVFLESIKSVDFAGNFVVVKCFPGMANAVCVAVDTGTWDGLVGTIAGDEDVYKRQGQTCRDAGENAIGAKIELAGKVTLVVVSIPLFQQLINVAGTLLNLS